MLASGITRPKLEDDPAWLGPKILAIGGAAKKMFVDERVQNDRAGVPVEVPQTLCLRERQPQARCFQVINPDPMQQSLETSLLGANLTEANLTGSILNLLKRWTCF